MSVAEGTVEDSQMTAMERDHYERIKELEKSCAKHQLEYERLKEDAKYAKALLDGAIADLRRTIFKGPAGELQPDLPFGEQSDGDEDWRNVDIGSVLTMTQKQAELLNSVNIETLGAFEDLRACKWPEYSDGLRSLKGVGQATVDKWEAEVMDFWQQFNKEGSDQNVSS